MTLFQFNPKWFDSKVLMDSHLQSIVEDVEYQQQWEVDNMVTVVVKFRNRHGVLLKANLWIPRNTLYVTMENDA